MSWDWPSRWDERRPFDWAREEMQNLGWPCSNGWPRTRMEAEYPEQPDEIHGELFTLIWPRDLRR